ncbi:MAG TPA: class I SAM-dependent methyltransferase [Herpetosiphonaceae bacterium]
MTALAPDPVSYYANARADVLRQVPLSARNVLDVGCGAGALGASIKRRQQARVVGIEYVREQAAHAATLLDAVHPGDVAAVELPDPPASFDCLIYADVLEHLVDPWAVLARHRELIAPGGTLLVSLPNVQFAGVLVDLLRGRWEYRARGVMDRTHLRFWTRRSAEALIAGAGYEVVGLRRNMRWWDDPSSRLHRFARIMQPLPWLRDLFTYQYLFVARPVPR